MADIAAQTGGAAATGRINFSDDALPLPGWIVTGDNGTNKLMTKYAAKIHVATSDLQIGVADTDQVRTN